MAAVQLTREEFYEALKGEKPVLVDFWAPWCTYCRRIHAAYESIAEEYRDALLVAKIDIDVEPALTEEEKIELVPTLKLYQNGKVLGSIVAPESKAAIEAFIQENLGEEMSQMVKEEYTHDMVVIGGGPAGYTAALYAARAGLDTVVLEKLSAGGQMALTHQIDNYPGFDEGVDGVLLAEKMQKGAERFGAKSEFVEVVRVDLQENPKRIETTGGTYYGKTVVIATGANPKELGVANEKELIGRGVAYCAACDGMFFKDKDVVVVGGGNSAVADAIILSRIARKVTIVHRRDTLRATRVYHEQLMRMKNVTFAWNSAVDALLFDEKIKGVRLKDTKTGEMSEIACDGVFVSVGRKPATDIVKEQLTLDAGGYIVADETTKTNIPGVYAVGDVRTKTLRQVVTAVADGAMAVHAAEEYLAER